MSTEYETRLRDYFAGNALQGFCSDDSAQYGEKFLAEKSYRIADAMMLERLKKQGGEG